MEKKCLRCKTADSAEHSFWCEECWNKLFAPKKFSRDTVLAAAVWVILAIFFGLAFWPIYP